MNVGITTFSPTFAVSREEAEVEVEAGTAEFDKDVYEAALALCASGAVGFKIARRVDASQLPKPKRRFYAALRLVPRKWFVPPALAKQKGIFDGDRWFDAVNACKTSDYQLLVLPLNRCYDDDEDDDGKWDVTVECRPRDPTDSKRFKALEKVFGVCPAPVDIREIEDRLTMVEERLEKLFEASKGT